MFAKTISSALLGIDAYPVSVEVHITPTTRDFYHTVGLPDAAVKESRDRVMAAMRNCGFHFDSYSMIVNLAPADVKKEGSSFDLPIAVAILSALGMVPGDTAHSYCILGELSLDGEVRPVRGALPIAAEMRKHRIKGLLLPAANAMEAAIVKNIHVYPVTSLPELVEFLRGHQDLQPVRATASVSSDTSITEFGDFSEVKGQAHAKRALEVAAAGGHNVLMIGPPGSGKTMLAKRLPTILPSPSLDEAIETTKIYSTAGLLSANEGLITRRPFRAPHHTISDAGLIGGGAIPMPGEVSLAHNGILYLDELPEFKRNVLEVLRQPLEDGSVTISRAITSLTFPARFMLIASMNPCPCGYKGSDTHSCRCTLKMIRKYRSRISGPLMDRIDLHIEVPALRYREMTDTRSGENSTSIKERVLNARKVQIGRYHENGFFTNAAMNVPDLENHCSLDKNSQNTIEMAVQRLGLSARAYHRILKVARTIADLEHSESILNHHVSEAIQYRTMDRKQLSESG